MIEIIDEDIEQLVIEEQVLEEDNGDCCKCCCRKCCCGGSDVQLEIDQVCEVEVDVVGEDQNEMCSSEDDDGDDELWCKWCWGCCGGCWGCCDDEIDVWVEDVIEVGSVEELLEDGFEVGGVDIFEVVIVVFEFVNEMLLDIILNGVVFEMFVIDVEEMVVDVVLVEMFDGLLVDEMVLVVEEIVVDILVLE